MPKVEAIIGHLRTFWGYFLAVMEEDIYRGFGAVLMRRVRLPMSCEVILYCWWLIQDSPQFDLTEFILFS